MRTLFSDLPEIFVCKDGDLFTCEKQNEDGTWMKLELTFNEEEVTECRFVKLGKHYRPTGQQIEELLQTSYDEHDGQMALAIVKAFHHYHEVCGLVSQARDLLVNHGYPVEEAEVCCAV
jgi:hypothetical protein